MNNFWTRVDLGYGAKAPCKGALAAVPRPAGKAVPRPAPATTATRNVRRYRECIESREECVQKHHPFIASGSEPARTTATRSIAPAHKRNIQP